MSLMKTCTRWLLLLGLSLALLEAGEARAEVFHTARTLKPRAFSLGLEPQLVLTSPTGVELNFHGGVGLVQGLDLGVRYSLPLSGPVSQQLALDLEVEFLRDTQASPAISLSLGGHITDWNRYWLDGTLMISKVIRRFEPYIAVDADFSLPPYSFYAQTRLVGGLSIHLSRVTELLIEGGWGVRNSPSHVSLGLSFYI